MNDIISIDPSGEAMLPPLWDCTLAERENLERAQVAWEEAARVYSRERYQAARERRPEYDGLNRKLIEPAVRAVAEALQRWIDEKSQGKRGRPPRALDALRTLGAEKAARVGLIACLALEPQDRSIATVMVRIGSDIERELDLEQLVQRDEKLARGLFRRAEKEYPGSQDLQLWAIRRAVGELYEPELHWTKEEWIEIGREVLERIVLTSGLFVAMDSEKKWSPTRHNKDHFRNTTQLQLGFTEEAMAAREALAELCHMFHPPMVVMPHQWPRKPYRTAEINRELEPIRHARRDHRKVLKERHKAGDLDRFYAALNRLQSVPYAINRGVLSVLTALWENRERVSKMPREPFAVPDRPEKPEKLATWERQRKEILRKNASEIPAQQLHFEQTLRTATRLASFERFYVPVSADFRGRVVPISMFHYHLEDPFRALFQFANGKPLGDYGLGWLMIRLANCGDFGKVSKKSFDERRQWVKDNLGWILDCARDPMANRRWTEADEPFQFLAAAMEIEAALACPGGPSEYVSHLAIDLDGSNNGLQHYSAIMRSPEEAEKVNLIRRPEPADVYEIVATEVRKLIAEDTDEKTREVRERWLAFNDGKGPSRKEAKRCVMTSLYGSEEYGFRDHLMEDLMDKLTNKVLAGELDNHPLAITDTWGKETAALGLPPTWPG